ncbi:MAG: aminotransferase class IV, partial [Planctomycetota bacterium]|nr:aminotransferase class IV [Planctomycetota bacterium]
PGVYEGLRTFERTRFFGLRTHLERLERSIAGFGEPLEYDRAAFVRTLDAVAHDAARVFDCEARVRIDVAAGPATALGSDSNVLVAVSPYRGLPAHVTEHGALLRTACSLSRPAPAVKTSNFIPLREAWIRAHGDADAYEHVMVGPEGELLEGTQSNLVLVRDGAVVAPPSGILPGVTMGAVLDLAAEQGLEVRREFVTFAELEDCEEAFITTSVRSVVPVSRIDERTFPNGGPVTRRLSALYDALTIADAAPASDHASARY